MVLFMRASLEHGRFRQKWDRLYSSEVDWKPPVILWASGGLHERVNLWRTCSWLRHLGIPCSDVLIIELEPVYGTMKRFSEPPAIPPFDCSASVAHHPDNVLLDRLDRAAPWQMERYDRAVRLWDSYVDENPLPFAESCAHGVEGFPELAPLWKLLSCFFPGRSPGGVLRLSRFDELILAILSTEEWQTPVKVYCNRSHLGSDLRDLGSCTGDLFVEDRLNQWAKHDSSAAVERAPGPKPSGDRMLSKVYRLTDRGQRLLDKGLERLTDAPILPMGGIDAYSASAPWALLEDGRLARL
ncbi:hypothetical protein [Sorangium sp. So ce1151]|uniref:hypothetical protein n=1 Tax=Sorangium sp. So ce1151 TaxID=3133332 RepID=UPI003F5FA759